MDDSSSAKEAYLVFLFEFKPHMLEPGKEEWISSLRNSPKSKLFHWQLGLQQWVIWEKLFIMWWYKRSFSPFPPPNSGSWTRWRGLLRRSGAHSCHCWGFLLRSSTPFYKKWSTLIKIDLLLVWTSTTLKVASYWVDRDCWALLSESLVSTMHQCSVPCHLLWSALIDSLVTMQKAWWETMLLSVQKKFALLSYGRCHMQNYPCILGLQQCRE